MWCWTASKRGWNNLNGCEDFRTENDTIQGRNRALTGSLIPRSFDSECSSLTRPSRRLGRVGHTRVCRVHTHSRRVCRAHKWRLNRRGFAGGPVFTSHKVSFKSFCKSQFPQKSVNMFVMLVTVKDELTDLWGCSLLQNDSKHTLCETSVQCCTSAFPRGVWFGLSGFCAFALLCSCVPRQTSCGSLVKFNRGILSQETRPNSAVGAI